MAIVLDTNIVRGTGAGDVDPSGIVELRRAGARIHLADGTMWELTHQLLTGAFPWRQWTRAREVLRNLLDADEPVLIGGRLGLHYAGLHDLHPYNESSIATNIALCNAGWKLLIEAADASGLGQASIELPVERMVVSLPLDHARTAHAQRVTDWINGFEEFKRQFLERSPDLPAALPSHDLRGPLAIYVQVVAAKRDRWQSESGPKPSVRLDAAIRVEGLLRLRYLRTRETYSPVKHANDSFDCELLRYLAYPVAVCTGDRGLIAKVVDSGSWQRKWIVHPDQLNQPAVRAEIGELRWPTDKA